MPTYTDYSGSVLGGRGSVWTKAAVWAQNPGRGTVWIDDFHVDSTGNYDTQLGGGATFAISADAVGGQAVLTTGALDNDECGVGLDSTMLLPRGAQLGWDCRILLGDIANTSVLFGMMEASTWDTTMIGTAHTAAAMFAANTDWVGIHIAQADDPDGVTAGYANGATAITTVSGTTTGQYTIAAATNWLRLSMSLTGGRYHFNCNGTSLGSVNWTTVGHAGTEDFKPVLIAATAEVAANTVTVDYFAFACSKGATDDDLTVV